MVGVPPSLWLEDTGVVLPVLFREDEDEDNADCVDEDEDKDEEYVGPTINPSPFSVSEPDMEPCLPSSFSLSDEESPSDPDPDAEPETEPEDFVSFFLRSLSSPRFAGLGVIVVSGNRMDNKIFCLREMEHGTLW